MNEQNEATVEPGSLNEFIERFAVLTEEEGASRSAGRIFALLMASGASLSFSAIAKRLQLSRGGVSTNLRLLVEMGLVERVTRPGDRQDFFQVPENTWRRSVERQLARELKARMAIETLLDSQPDLPKAARDRLTRVVALTKRSNRFTAETLAMMDRGELY